MKANHLLNYLNAGLRFDGRNLTDYRDISIETKVAINAEGSARVKIGETVVIAGVKFEIGTPYPDTPNEGSFMVNVELIPLSSPDFESGPPSDFAVELARVVDRGIRESKAIDLKKLCIKEKEKAWVIVIDICTLNDDGNLFDAIALSAAAALKSAVYPKLNEDMTIDYKDKTKEKLPLNSIPMEVTVSKVGKYLIVDPTTEEEKFVESRLSVAVTEDGKLCALQKGGSGTLTSEDLSNMVKLAIEKASFLRSKL